MDLLLIKQKINVYFYVVWISKDKYVGDIYETISKKRSGSALNETLHLHKTFMYMYNEIRISCLPEKVH